MTTHTNPEGGWWVAALVLWASPQTLGLGVGGRCRLDLTYTLKSQSPKRRGTRWRGGVAMVPLGESRPVRAGGRKFPQIFRGS